MIQVDRIIATVALPNQRPVDMELPAFMPIGELSEKILETLSVLYPNLWSNTNKIRLRFFGQSLGEDTTLAENGIWDGAILEVERSKRK